MQTQAGESPATPEWSREAAASNSLQARRTRALRRKVIGENPHVVHLKGRCLQRLRPTGQKKRSHKKRPRAKLCTRAYPNTRGSLYPENYALLSEGSEYLSFTVKPSSATGFDRTGCGNLEYTVTVVTTYDKDVFSRDKKPLITPDDPS
jgi:hypothetical protein